MIGWLVVLAVQKVYGGIGGLERERLEAAKRILPIIVSENGERYPNFIFLEHVNLNHDNEWTQEMESFWFETLHFAKDPRSVAVLNLTNTARKSVQADSMGGLRWMNVGLQQFHLPFNDALEQDNGNPRQTLRGEIVLAWPKGEMFSELVQRLETSHRVISYDKDREQISFFGPFRNRFSVYTAESSERFGPVRTEYQATAALPGGLTTGIGMKGLKLDVPIGTASSICHFYTYIYQVQTLMITSSHCRVMVGTSQFLDFIELPSPDHHLPAYDGHHIAIYLQGPAFLESYRRLRDLDLVYFNPRFPQFKYDTLDDILLYNEYRFKNIIDLSSDKTNHDVPTLLFELEHEVRNIRHQGLNPLREIMLPTTLLNSNITGAPDDNHICDGQATTPVC